MTEVTNPLFSYFRNPVHVKLPSRGKFFKNGKIKTSLLDDVAIYPMTTADEIILKNPDSLLNGHALECLMKSCVPDISDVREISIPDINVILLGIKLATFGDRLEIKSSCPECKTENSEILSVRLLIDSATPVPEDNSVRLNDELVAYIRPYDFEARTILDNAAFEETKMAEFLLKKKDLSESERLDKFNKSFEKIARLNLDLLSRCIVKIQTPDSVVEDQNHIAEFIRNSHKDLTKEIQSKISELSECGVIKKIDVTCSNEECKHEYEHPLIFDPTTFFELSS